jgi:hypothetical protein
MHIAKNSENDAIPTSYHIVFRGEVLPNFTPEQVQQRLAQGLKLHDKKISR